MLYVHLNKSTAFLFFLKKNKMLAPSSRNHHIAFSRPNQ